MITNVIREYRPDLLFYPSSVDSHPDHVAASELINESIFHAKLKRFESIYPPFHVTNSYKYHINDITTSDFFVDISEEYEIKMKALEAYSSQFASKSLFEKTRLNNGFLSYLESVNRSSGFKCGVDYAEGFIKSGPIVIKKNYSFGGSYK